ncbi:MAG: glycosyltransferase family 39 protein [Pseudomonadota bacterium]
MSVTSANMTDRWIGLHAWLGDIAAWLTASHARALAALVALALLCFTPGFFSIPPVDRDEGRYAQASKQMMETGDYVDIWFHDDPRHKQPAGIYWMQVASATVTGYGTDAPIWVYRLPSLLGATLVVLLTYWIGVTLGGRSVGLMAGAAMAACVLLGVEARLAKTDAMLNAMILIAQGVLATLYVRAGSGRAPPSRGLTPTGDHAVPLWLALAFWAACGAGIMIKGPILALFVVLTIVTLTILERDIGWLAPLRPLIGLLVMLAIALPWMVAIGIVTDGAFFAKAVGWNVMGKVVDGHQSHGAPPGYFSGLVWFTFWPSALLLAVSLPALWSLRKDRAIRFLLAWIVPAWIAFEMFATKLPHYVLPTYPAIAILGAIVVLRGASAIDRAWGRALLILSISGVIIAPVAGLVALYYFEAAVSVLAILGLVAAIILAAIAFGLVRARHLVAAWAVSALAMVPVYWSFYQGVVPKVETIWIAPRLAEAVTEAAACDDPQVLATDLEEASVIFLIGTDIRFDTAGAAVEFLAEDTDAGTCSVAIVARGHVDAVRNGLSERGVDVTEAASVTGLNIGNGRMIDVAVMRRSAP